MIGGFEALETVVVADFLKSFIPYICQLLRSQTPGRRCGKRAVALSADSVECPSSHRSSGAHPVCMTRNSSD